MGTLEGKTALVTGATSGLGERFALVLARAGARVAITGRRVDRLDALERKIATFDGRAMPLQLDVTDIPAIEAAVDAAETELGPISILVNNAGISLEKRLVDITPADYDRLMNTNVKAAFFVAQAVGRRMIERGDGGQIIVTASMAAKKVSPGLGVYAMSKAAVAQMTRAMALEWARYDINVNALCPGYIETEINREFFASEAGQKMVQRFPRRRLGVPEDLDELILLLASERSRLLTGALIDVDDGQGL